jgi:hypothetical protein
VLAVVLVGGRGGAAVVLVAVAVAVAVVLVAVAGRVGGDLWARWRGGGLGNDRMGV